MGLILKGRAGKEGQKGAFNRNGYGQELSYACYMVGRVLIKHFVFLYAVIPSQGIDNKLGDCLIMILFQAYTSLMAFLGILK